MTAMNGGRLTDSVSKPVLNRTRLLEGSSSPWRRSKRSYEPSHRASKPPAVPLGDIPRQRTEDDMIRFWLKRNPEAKPVGGADARQRSEMALIEAKAQRMRAEEVTRRITELGTQNGFSEKIANMIRTGSA